MNLTPFPPCWWNRPLSPDHPPTAVAGGQTALCVDSPPPTRALSTDRAGCVVAWHGHLARECHGRPGRERPWQDQDGPATHGRDAHATGCCSTTQPAPTDRKPPPRHSQAEDRQGQGFRIPGKAHQTLDAVAGAWDVGGVARLARVATPGYPHHVTQRGNRRQKTFFSQADYAPRCTVTRRRPVRRAAGRSSRNSRPCLTAPSCHRSAAPSPRASRTSNGIRYGAPGTRRRSSRPNC